MITPGKASAGIYICSGYRFTINKALQQYSYPFPVMNHLFLALIPEVLPNWTWHGFVSSCLWTMSPLTSRQSELSASSLAFLYFQGQSKHCTIF